MCLFWSTLECFNPVVVMPKVVPKRENAPITFSQTWHNSSTNYIGIEELDVSLINYVKFTTNVGRRCQQMVSCLFPKTSWASQML
jgi:hypothetical protein